MSAAWRIRRRTAWKCFNVSRDNLAVFSVSALRFAARKLASWRKLAAICRAMRCKSQCSACSFSRCKSQRSTKIRPRLQTLRVLVFRFIAWTTSNSAMGKGQEIRLTLNSWCSSTCSRYARVHAALRRRPASRALDLAFALPSNASKSRPSLVSVSEILPHGCTRNFCATTDRARAFDSCCWNSLLCI